MNKPRTYAIVVGKGEDRTVIGISVAYNQAEARVEFFASLDHPLRVAPRHVQAIRVSTSPPMVGTGENLAATSPPRGKVEPNIGA